MKNLKKFMMLFMAISLFAVTSCGSNDDDNDNADNGSNEFLNVKINGTSWNSSTGFDLTSASKGGGTLSVQASNDVGEAIRFTIVNYNGTGTYTTGDNMSNTNSISYVTVSPVATWSSTFDIGTGTIEITVDENNVVEGSFSFEGFNATDQSTKVFTDGNFRANVDQ